MYQTFIMPVEWATCLSGEGDPEDCGFEEEQFCDWLRDNTHLSYAYLGESIRTSGHVLDGYYEGETLVCQEVVFFDNSRGSTRRQVRRELRISVPAPTKLPLP